MTVTAVTAPNTCMTSHVFEKLCLVSAARVASAAFRVLCVTRPRLGPALGGADLTFCDNRQIRVFLVLRYIFPLATSRSAVRPWMVRWSSPSSIGPSNSGHRV